MTLLVQLEKNLEDTGVTIQELDFLEGTEDQNYDLWVITTATGIVTMITISIASIN